MWQLVPLQAQVHSPHGFWPAIQQQVRTRGRAGVGLLICAVVQVPGGDVVCHVEHLGKGAGVEHAPPISRVCAVRKMQRTGACTTCGGLC